MKKFLSIMGEVGISFLLVIVAAGVNVYYFYDKYPLKFDIATARTYESIEKSKYTVVGDSILNAQNPTETFQATPQELETSQSEYRYIPGSANPFNSPSSESNLPSDTIGGTYTPSYTESAPAVTTNTTENDGPNDSVESNAQDEAEDSENE